MLLIDDDPVFLAVLSKAMSKSGFRVLSAQSVESGIAQARQHAPDCAVVDLRLPDESGLQAVGALRAIRPDMRILMLTGYASIATTVEAIKAGATGYLAKPADAGQILAALYDDAGAAKAEPRIMSVHEVEWEHLQRALREHNGNISETARALNLHRRTLQRKLTKRPSPGRADIE